MLARAFLLAGVAGVLFLSMAGGASAEVDSKGTASRAPSTRIVGGNEAEPGEWPWQAALVRHSDNGGNDFERRWCGGSLIEADLVLTAAHCVSGPLDDPSDFQVVLGRHTLSDSSEGERLDVEDIVVHEDFDEATLEYDVALVKPSTPSSQATVPLVGEDEAELWEPGDTATVTGWGATSQGGAASDDLQEASVPIWSDPDCEQAYRDYFLKFVSSVMFCAAPSGGGVDTCQGDSGGPLVVPDRSGAWRLAGVTSWGQGCAQQGKPGVYTRIGAPALRQWILARTNPPANDSFASAQLLRGTSATVTGINFDATRESGEPEHAGNAGGNSVWYRWTPQSSGHTTITTAGSSFDTLVAVYTGGAVSALTEVQSNDDDPNDPNGGLHSRVDFAARAGATYWIAVDGYNGKSGSITLSLRQPDTVAPRGTVAINGRAATTTSRRVRLHLAATDNPGGSGVALMRVSNNGTSWSRWVSFASRYPWTLAGSSAGTKRVYVQYRDRAGNVSARVNDTIRYVP